ncbi:MAG: transporter substrate-binding domain-containing protein [Anaerolineae bacterium]|nr:transporter substrate-binding domain-containing protein [Anaerolineae bacterium]
MTALKRQWLRAVIAGLIALMAWPHMRDVYRSEVHWRALRQRGTLIVGIDPNTYPLSYYDASGWNGLEADVMRAVAQRLQLQLVTEPVGYDAMYDALKLGRVDAIISSVQIDPTQTEAIGFSRAYFDAGLRLVMPKAQCCSMSDAATLKNQRVAVALGSEADRLLRYWQRRVVGLNRITVASDAEAISALHDGHATLAIVPALTPSALIRNNALDYRVIASVPYVIGVKRENQHLLSRINQALSHEKAVSHEP